LGLDRPVRGNQAQRLAAIGQFSRKAAEHRYVGPVPDLECFHISHHDEIVTRQNGHRGKLERDAPSQLVPRYIDRSRARVSQFDELKV